MENVVEREESTPEREESTPEREECACRSGASLDVLQDVTRAYEQRLELVQRLGGKDTLQMQERVLRSWVSDLVAQNALLVRAVRELEVEAAARAAAERTRHQELEEELRAEAGVLRRRLARKDADLRGLLELLRRLRDQDLCDLQGIHFFEVTHSDIFGSDDWLPRRRSGGGDSGSDAAPPAAAAPRRLTRS